MLRNLGIRAKTRKAQLTVRERGINKIKMINIIHTFSCYTGYRIKDLTFLHLIFARLMLSNDAVEHLYSLSIRTSKFKDKQDLKFDLYTFYISPFKLQLYNI